MQGPMSSGKTLTEYVEPFESVHHTLLHAPFSTERGMSARQPLSVVATHL
jgi:hypothetical protein